MPLPLRKILELIYEGRCQVSNFTFTQRNGKPYFEIHHIKSDLGNHFKNLLVVSPNIHAMFTHANCEEYFDNNGWLREVRLNDKNFNRVDFPDPGSPNITPFIPGVNKLKGLIFC